MIGWKHGLPPGKYYDGMLADYAVSFTVMGGKWHRKRTEEEKRAYLAAIAANRAAWSPSPISQKRKDA